MTCDAVNMASAENSQADNAQLFRRLDAAATRRGDVSVALYASGETRLAGSSTFDENSRIHVGCIAKFLTATLVARAVASRRLGWQTSLAALLDEPALEGIEVQHLLNHTHGLDPAVTEDIPRVADGYIDWRALCSAVSARPRLGPPGETFNYGNIGCWLAGAVLERVCAVRFSALVAQWLDDCVAPTNPRDWCSSGEVCPANGGDLLLSSHELLRVAVKHMRAADSPGADAFDAELVTLRSRAFVPPGWQPKFKRVCLGMKDFGADWFGHNAKLPGESTVVRFSPTRDVAVAITSRSEEGAHAALGAILGQDLPEFASMQVPRYLTREEWASVDPAQFMGRYENGSLAVLVDVGANGALRARAYVRTSEEQNDTEAHVKRYLKASTENVFFSVPPDPLLIPYVQFLQPDELGGFRFLSTGRQLLRRIVPVAPETA